MINLLLRLLILRQRTTHKHLRGRHDQRDHAWNRGMGRGATPAGGGADGLSQMEIYQKTRQSLLDMVRQGQTTRQDVRNQLRELRGLPPISRRQDVMNNRVQGGGFRNESSNPVPQNTTNASTLQWAPMKVGRDGSKTIETKEQLIQQIKDIQSKRNARRLPQGINISQEIRSATINTEGMSKVKELYIADGSGNEKKYFYRNTPIEIKNTIANIDKNWLGSNSSINAIVADDLSSAMGLNIAPVSQVSNEGSVLTESYESMSLGIGMNQEYTPENISSSSEWLAKRREIESIAILDLLLGQSDGHIANYGKLPENNEDIMQSMIVGFDFDYSGSSTNKNHNGSYAAMTYFDVLYGQSKDLAPSSEKGFLSNEMRQLLTVIPETIEWNDAVPEITRDQILSRVNHLLKLDSEYNATSDINIQDEMFSYSLNRMFDMNINTENPMIAARHLTGRINLLVGKAFDFTNNASSKLNDNANIPQEVQNEVNNSINNIQRYRRTLVSIAAELYSFFNTLSIGDSVEDYPTIEQFTQDIEDMKIKINNEMSNINRLMN